ncbi:hypothetical protein DB346_00550 [Verrucomicrobia bacterium LW23]|nr:hypothetical protein DB346_00550 [Verrucomicrobia bacterium LW23]
MLRSIYAPLCYAVVAAAVIAAPGGPVVVNAQQQKKEPLPANLQQGKQIIEPPPANVIADAKPWRSALYPEDWKPGFADARGHFLHDFSYAGYHRGEKPIPPRQSGSETTKSNTLIISITDAKYAADPTGGKDSTAGIQQALDDAAKATAGNTALYATVLIPAGTYRIGPPPGKNVALQLNGDRVVLAGEGTDKSFLFTDVVDLRGKTLVQVRPPYAAEWGAEKAPIPSTPITADLPNQSDTVPVADASIFSTGDIVILRSDLTQRFIDELGMTGKWQPAGALSPNRTLMFCRRVTSVDTAAKTIRLDAPTRFRMKTDDMARVVKIPGKMISESGLRDFSVGMKQHPGTGFEENDFDVKGTAGYEVHGSTAIQFAFAENCWAYRVNSYGPAGNAPDVHILSNGMRISRSRYVTLQGCDWKHAQYKGGGGNGYHFTVHGQENLVLDCKAEGGRHNYSFGTMFSSGNVISRFYSKNAKLGADFHMFLSMSNLLDDITCEGDFLEARLFRPWGGNPIHGLTTTQSVFWNTNGLRYSKEKAVLVLSHQYGEGYVIGTRGPACRVDSSDFVEGVGLGEKLVPQSLYADQVERRLKREAAAAAPAAPSREGGAAAAAPRRAEGVGAAPVPAS